MAMKQFWCGAVIPECTAKFVGKDEADILRQVAEHAERDHGLKQIPENVVARVKELISDAA